MTALIATVTPLVGYLSQDTLVCREDPSSVTSIGGISEDVEATTRGTFVGDGTPPTVEKAGYLSKITVLPHLQAIVGATGCSAMALAWKMCLFAGLNAANIEELDNLSPDGLRTLRRQIPGDAGFISVQIGYSAVSKRVVGFAYDSTKEFTSVPLAAGHFMSPPPNVQDRDYLNVTEKWVGAVEGQEVGEFHRLVALNQHRSFESGLFRGGVGIGGKLITARVMQDAIEVKTVLNFDDRKSP